MSLKILLVEDDHNTRTMLTLLLQKEGYEIITAENGEDGLHLALNERVSAVVLDLALPIMNGFDFCRQLRSRPGLGKLPVLVLSAHAGDEDIKKALAAGADRFLTKPVHTQVLLNTLNQLLFSNPPWT